MLKWILCEDEMPIEDEEGTSKQVLLTVEYKLKHKPTCKREVIVSQTFKGEWIGFLTEKEVESVECIAWSEFPEPYQEVEENYYINFDEKKMKEFLDGLQVNREIQKKKCDCNDKVKHLSKKVVKLQRKNKNLEEMVKQYKELLYQTTKLLKEDKNG